MAVISNFNYSKESIEQIKNWSFGTNWPAVYIIYNDRNAYVVQTADLVKRTGRHLLEPQFNEFTDICLISDKTYNKSWKTKSSIVY